MSGLGGDPAGSGGRGRGGAAAGFGGEGAVGGAVDGGVRFLVPAVGEGSRVDGVVADRVEVGGDGGLSGRVVAGDGQRGTVLGAGRVGQGGQVPVVDVVEH